MTTPYLQLADYRGLTLIPPSYINKVEEADAGFTLRRLEVNSARIEGYLRKRYVTPLTAPYPDFVRTWLTSLTDYDVWMRRGVSSTDESFVEYTKIRDEALAEIQRAADGVAGNIDLPRLADADGTAVAKQGPRSYSETSPYVWQDVQHRIAREEDSWGEGTRRG